MEKSLLLPPLSYVLELLKIVLENNDLILDDGFYKTTTEGRDDETHTSNFLACFKAPFLTKICTRKDVHITAGFFKNI